MKDPWFHTVTRPVGHLVSTIAVFIVLAAAVALSVMHPQWMGALGIIGAAPAVAWYLYMMREYKKNRAHWLRHNAPPTD